MVPALQPLAPPATTFTVNDLGDTGDATPDGVCDDGSGKCTLRAAIQEANSVAGADPIDFSVTGTIQLGGVLPNLSTDITINGPGANLLTVRRNTGGNYGIFTINGGTVAISGLTIAHGAAANGGGILNDGTVTITNSTLASGIAASGGGIYNNGTADNYQQHASPVIPAGTAAYGGGIYNTAALDDHQQHPLR